ncbi:MAG: hypothetical protein SVU69_01595 [Pseudomonadota bacterium]|nr:hypothetical protein [Pseudomonadota bacterium]
MDWLVLLAHFAAGALLSNSIPHLVNGISGNPFQTPFASPPGVGESSPLVNVLWGGANLILGWLLLFGVGDFQAGNNLDSYVVIAGALLLAIGLSIHFGRVRNPES